MAKQYFGSSGGGGRGGGGGGSNDHCGGMKCFGNGGSGTVIVRYVV